MDITSPSRGWWDFHPYPPQPRSVVELMQAGTLDAELAALCWLLLEGRVPLIVAAERSGTGKSTLLGALVDFLPPRTRRVELRGFAEDFDWLPHARELGWPRRPDAPLAARERADPGSTYLLAAELSDHHPHYIWGDAARVTIRALAIGYGLGATIHADSLEEVFDRLHGPPVAVTSDELSRLGIVLVMRAVSPAPGDVADGPVRRVVAAHYVRPMARDAHGHVQRLPPAILATWDPNGDRFDHFAWGITPELAVRVGRRAGDFAAELERRRDYLAGLAEAGVDDVDAVRAALDGFRSIATSHAN